MAETAGSASPKPDPPHEDPQSLFSEIEALRRQVIDLQADNVRWQNAHKVAMAEREYWFKKWNALYEQHRAK
jgi:hypothetical protein